MADEVSNKCKHGPCDCAAENDSKYCSEYCKEADTVAHHGNWLRL
jgi:hypothetical protein